MNRVPAYHLDQHPELMALVSLQGLGKSRVNRPYPQRYLNVLPGLNSGDPRFLRFLVKLNEAYDDLSVDPTNGLFDPSGRLPNSGKIATCAGWGKSFGGYIMHDNSSLVTSTGFKKEWHRKLYHNLIDLMFGRAVYTSLRFAAKSNSGYPLFTSDAKEKADFFLSIVQDGSKLDAALRAHERRDGKAALELGVPALYYQNWRLSPDKAGKERLVADFEYAESGGRAGKLVDSSAAVKARNGQVFNDIAECRARHVLGLSNGTNALLGGWLTACDRYYLNRFAPTFKVRGKEDLQERHNAYLREHPKGVFVSEDVKQLDNSIPSFLFDEFVDYVSGRYIDERLAEVLRNCLFGCVVQPHVNDGLGPSLHGDLYAMRGVRNGMLSGVYFVSPGDKLVVYFNYLVLIGEAFGVDTVLGKESDFLLHRTAIRQINAGDDQDQFYPDAATRDRVRDPNNLSKGYFKVETEKGLEFIGYTGLQGPQGSVQIEHNRLSMMINLLVCERPYDSKHFRPFWAEGLRERFALYRNHPGHLAYLEVEDRVFKECFPEFGTWSAYCNNLIRNYARHDFDVDWRIARILEKPERAIYEFGDDDDLKTHPVVQAVNPAVSVPYEEIPLYRDLCKSEPVHPEDLK